jgi:hypothetical protein
LIGFRIQLLEDGEVVAVDGSSANSHAELFEKMDMAAARLKAKWGPP